MTFGWPDRCCDGRPSATRSSPQQSVKPGAPVTNDAIEGGKAFLRQRLRETPALFESPVVVSVVTAAVDNCDEASKQLDVVYGVYTTKVPLVVSRVVESREAQEVDPATRLALAPTPLRFRLAPRLSYDRSNGVMGGAAISLAMGRVFDGLTADVQVSDSATFVDVAAASSRERSTGWLRVYEWSVGYHHADRPTDQETLKERAFVGYVTTVSRPLGSHGAIVRWSSLAEAGEQRTALATRGCCLRATSPVPTTAVGRTRLVSICAHGGTA